MNEKISYLNVFFQADERSFLRTVSEVCVDHFAAPVFMYHAGHRTILYGNRMFFDFIGKNPEALRETGYALESLVHPHDLACIGASLQAITTGASKQPERCTVRLSDRNGMYHYHTLDVNFVRDNGTGQAQAPLILFIAHDITEALKSKQEIETTRELLDETEELLQFGTWTWEVGTDAVTWTSGLYSLLGYTRQEIAEKLSPGFYLDHVLEEYNQPFRELIENSLKEKTDFSYEYVIKTNTGTLKNISTRGKLLKDEAGNVLKMLCINRDITSIRTFEKEQERNIRELNRSNRDLEEFAYIASHDLQEPLRKISMFTERLKAKFENGLDKEGELFIDRILASAANMRTLIDNLLDFSRANRRSQTFDSVDLQTILHGVISELELTIEETKANIQFAGNFPTIEAVSSEMTQLFNNILSNAIKFRKKDVVAEITVASNKLSKAEKHVLGYAANQTFYKIEVRDNGIGFEPEYAEKIFQIFQRLNGKSEYPGSGIGLAICKKIVEKHNGFVFAKSQPDEGAVFTIILPEKQF